MAVERIKSAAAASFIDVSAFDLREHIAQLNREYNTRLKLMVELLKRPAWKGSSYDLPSGGMFLWVAPPEGMDVMALLKCALGKGVAFCQVRYVV